MALNLQALRHCLQEFEFEALFSEHLGWDHVAERRQLAVDGEVFALRGVADLAGVTVYTVTGTGEIPGAKVRAEVHREVSQTKAENLLIFLNGAETQSLWYWVKREGQKLYRRDHFFAKGQAGDLFLSKLGSLVVDLKDWEAGDVTVLSAVRRLKEGFDVETVTKRFFTEFQGLHLEFLSEIQGIPHEADRRWYASVLLNRLMFIYFLQRKYFLDRGDEWYLQNRLQESQAAGTDQFYDFLQDLFFEGFAKPANLRDAAVAQRIGQISYLNGGLFLPHEIERKYPQIRVNDRAFAQVLDLFSRYSWNLDDTPAGNDEEINPDVLGYIFE
ncbi:MAG: ATP-binding protein, partial [Prochlorothrix sp.]